MSQKQQEQLDVGLAPIHAEEREVEAVQTEQMMPASAAPILPSAPMAETSSMTDAQEMQTSGDGQPTGEAPQKKRRKRKGKWVSVEEVSPKPSPWPLALTVSICLLLMGIMIHPIVIGVGALLVIVSLMGWMLERR